VHAHNPRRGSAAPNVNGSVAAAIAATEVSAGALCEVRSLGVTSYADGLALQHQLVQQRTRNTIPDQLVLLQHTHVVTQGRNTQAGNVLLGEAALRAKGIELYETDRGGDVTYHGPGQLVAYPCKILPGRKSCRDRILAGFVSDPGKILPGAQTLVSESY
jgi:lipoate-protein ligase B